MLELSLTRAQGEFLVDVNLTAGQGVTALFGRSGSGKTSVINMVAGLTRPDHGRIVVEGRVLFDSKTRVDVAPEKRRLGYVFQDGRLFPHLVVKSNLLFGQRRIPAAERRVELDQVVDVLGIGHLLDRRPALLSGGEKQRVAIGRALLASPRILLMDEPLAALDASRKDEVLPFIDTLSRQFGIPIVYVSHSMDEVLRLADTLVVMDDGKAAAFGTVEEILGRTDLRPLTGRWDAGAVVNGQVAGHVPGDGITFLDFDGGQLQVPRLDMGVGARVRARIHARDITIALDRPGRISVRNILPMRVAEVIAVDDGHLFDVVLQAGATRLWAQITGQSQLEMRLTPGTEVHALIKAATIARGDVAASPGAFRPAMAGSGGAIGK